MKSEIKPQVDLLLDGKKDAKRLLILWYLRRTFYPLFLIGLVAAALTGRTEDANINWTDTDEVLSDILSPLVTIILAFVIKILVNILSLIAAYPVLKTMNSSRSDKELSIFLRTSNVLQALKGLRSLRWTYQIRQEAASRFENNLIKEGRLNKYINYGIAFLVVSLFITAIITV